jgi:hypothetical protein
MNAYTMAQNAIVQAGGTINCNVLSSCVVLIFLPPFNPLQHHGRAIGTRITWTIQFP